MVVEPIAGKEELHFRILQTPSGDFQLNGLSPRRTGT